jgi:hypothetical protein
MVLEEMEAKVLREVKFINYILEECRKRNKALADDFGMSYGKFVGVGTVYEEAIHSLRKVKGELDEFLKTVRGNLRDEYEHHSTAPPR